MTLDINNLTEALAFYDRQGMHTKLILNKGYLTVRSSKGIYTASLSLSLLDLERATDPLSPIHTALATAWKELTLQEQVEYDQGDCRSPVTGKG